MTTMERVAKALSFLPIRYVHNAEFEQEGCEFQILADMPDKEEFENNLLKRKKAWKLEDNTTTAMLSAPALVYEQERHLFRQMNYLKFKCNNAVIDEKNPDEIVLNVFEKNLKEIDRIRNIIIHCNLKLVSRIVVRNKVHRGDIQKYGDRMSDGYYKLFDAVNLFDYSRGNKFSTYAWWAVGNNLRRSIGDSYKQQSHEVPLDKHLDFKKYLSIKDAEFILTDLEQKEVVSKLMGSLDERTLSVICDRLGLEAKKIVKQGGLMSLSKVVKEKKSLKALGEEFNLSKERIRQIERNGLRRLRRFAEAHHPSFF